MHGQNCMMNPYSMCSHVRHTMHACIMHDEFVQPATRTPLYHACMAWGRRLPRHKQLALGHCLEAMLLKTFWGWT